MRIRPSLTVLSDDTGTTDSVARVLSLDQDMCSLHPIVSAVSPHNLPQLCSCTSIPLLHTNISREPGSGCFDSYNGAPQFAVDYWPGHAPAIFYGEAVYHYDASACGDPSTLVQEGIDYVVVILSEETGLPYMGIKAYDTAWNGPKYWYQQGYAADAGGTMYPYVQGPFSIVNEFSEGFGDILG
jgi:hypothetical protein